MKTKLDKEEVASRQLDTAIDLMFGGGDGQAPLPPTVPNDKLSDTQKKLAADLQIRNIEGVKIQIPHIALSV